MSGNRDFNDPGNSGRTEPKLGNLDQLHGPQPPVEPDDGLPRIQVEPAYRRGEPNGRDPYRKRHRWILPTLIVVLLAAVSGLWFNQTRLRSLVPRTDFDDVLHRAQVALQAGHLDGTDGTSARELFEAARALEPDNDAARQGLNEVGRAEVARADAAVHAGNLTEANQALTNARELLGGGSDVDRLAQAIAKAQVSSGQTDTLIAQAQQALSQNKLDGPDGAAALYQRVLSAEPDNAVARHGMDQVGDAMAAQIQKALSANDVASASAGIDRLAVMLPNYAQLPNLRASLSALQTQANSALNDAINQGNDALRGGRIAGDGNDTALAHFKAALAIDPNNAQAKVGLGQVAQALTVQANAAIDAGDTEHAKQLLDQAETLAPGSADLVAARARLAQAPAAQPVETQPPAATENSTATTSKAPTIRKQEQEEDTAPPPQPALTGQQQVQVADMVSRARQAAARGDIMSPPGDCAYDLYRGALAIDGNNPKALSGLQSLPGQVQQQFNQALRAGNLKKAGSLLDALGNLEPGDAALSISRQRLANAWIDQAEQQFDSGDRNNAASSLEQGRNLLPNDPRVRELVARMQAGR
jgi:tetratricopeptide (TPR) repeat protein